MTKLKRIALLSFIFFLSLSTLIAIISVLVGNFGQLEVKFLVTTIVVALASVCVLACSASSKASLANMGRVVAIVAAVMLIAGVWLEMSNDFFWKTSVILAVFAVAIAHFLVLNTVSLAAYQWLKISTGISIFALATLLTFLFINEFDNTPRRVLTLLSILVALQTVIIPILARINKAKAIEKLILNKKMEATRVQMVVNFISHKSQSLILNRECVTTFRSKFG